MTKKITPFLWFDDNAEEAAKFYVDVFGKYFTDSKITNMTRYPETGQETTGKAPGSVMTVAFEIGGENFTAINGGPYLKIGGGGISFVVDCENQEQVDYFWEKLSQGGETGQCGWINHDKFGMTWQIVPTVLPELLGSDNRQGANRAMDAMLKMKKLNISELQKAHDGN